MREQQNATSELHRLSPVFLKALSAGSSDGILVLGESAEPLFYNQRYLEIWGLKDRDLSGEASDLRHRAMADLTNDPEVFYTQAKNIIAAPHQAFNIEYSLKSGRVLNCSATPVIENDGKFVGQLITYRDVTAFRNVENQRNFLSEHDRITRLLNRNTMLERIKLAIESDTKSNRRLGAILLDLNNFKKINDHYGHVFGDRVLQAVADNIYSAAKTHTLSRYGEDEFLIFVNDTTPARIKKLAQKVLQRVESSTRVDGLDMNLSASVGISLYPEHDIDPHVLIEKADIAMRHARAQGIGKIEVFTKELGAKHDSQRDIESQLPLAIEGDCLSLYYQPLVDLASDQIIGAEALLRWECVGQGSIPPTNFLPFAEESGLIVEIGRWVLYTACNQILQWQKAGITNVPVSINVSAKQLIESDFVKDLKEALAQTGIAANLLQIELTETSFVQHMQRASTVTAAIRELGVRVAIDDFGTGYSSLSYLKHLNVDTLKIDKEFTQGIGKDKSDDALVATVISLAHNLGLQALAEGVEKPEQLHFLQEAGCDQAQGYLFSRPLPVADFTKLLQDAASTKQKASVRSGR